MVTMRALGVARFRREDYQRIREVSDDDMIATFEEWKAKITKVLPNYEAPGVILEEVIIDPEEPLVFARQFHTGKIDTKVRNAFAAFLIMKTYGTDHRA